MKIGLVLSGGGGKGAYELGVWKALKELEVDKYIDVFSGTSIGAFNAILFAQDDMKAAEELWKEVTMEKLVTMSKLDLIKKGVELAIGSRYLNIAKKYMTQKLESGGYPKDGAKSFIDKYLDVNKVKENNKTCYVACTKLPDFTATYFKINDYEEELAKNMILASSTLPLIYDSHEVLGSKYIDGGVVDNTPIQPVYGEGCDLIIVVLLSKDSRVDRDLYPNTRIIELSPKNLDESTIKGTLNLDSESKKMRIAEGYNDTMAELEPIMLMAKAKVIEEEKRKHPKLFKVYSILKKLS